MKKLFNTIILVLFVFTSGIVLAQPPDPDSDPNSNGGDPLGGSAHVGGGIIILLSLGAAYGGRKIYIMSKKDVRV